MLKDGERIDDLDLKGLRIIQNPEWFCFGIDAVLISDFSKAKRTDRVVDLGSGTGIIPLLMYGRYEPSEIIGVEIQDEVSDMAKRSITMNNLDERIRIYKGDIKDCFNSIGINSFDVAVSNPPYQKPNCALVNPHDKKAISRHEILISLDELIFSASRLLKGGGKFYMIHRPERLKDIIISLDKNKFTPKRMRFVHPYPGKKPTMVLIESAKAGGEFLNIEEPLYVYNEDGTYSDEINRIYGRC